MVDLSVGLIVIAPYQGDKYRARIVSMESENDIEVFFIDYGNRATVRLQVRYHTFLVPLSGWNESGFEKRSWRRVLQFYAEESVVLNSVFCFFRT